MSATRIEWADITINPVVGCSKCSDGCQNCFAERFAARLAKNPQTAAKYAGVVDASGRWTGKISEPDYSVFERLPKKPQRVFLGSMTDLFFHGVNDYGRKSLQTKDGTIYEFAPDTMHVRIAQILAGIGRYPQHTFMMLTKRPEAMKEALELMLNRSLPNLWLGVTVCNQTEADAKIPILLSIPAAKRFVSIEPMLGPVNLGFRRAPTDRDYRGWNGDGPIDYVETTHMDELHWVICGGETGPKARPVHPDWVRGLRDQCQEVGTPFFFKGWGEWVPAVGGKFNDYKYPSQGYMAPDGGHLPGPCDAGGCWGPPELEAAGCAYVAKVGKKRSGRLLDGREWNEVPQ